MGEIRVLYFFPLRFTLTQRGGTENLLSLAGIMSRLVWWNFITACVAEAGSMCNVTGKHQKLQGDLSTKPQKDREGVFTTVSQPGGMRGTIRAWERMSPLVLQEIVCWDKLANGIRNSTRRGSGSMGRGFKYLVEVGFCSFPQLELLC